MKLVDTQRRDIASATLVQTLWLVAACSVLFVLTAYASDPSWWSSVGHAEDAKTVVLQGQLKWFTARAVAELNADLPGGAGSDLNGLVTSWSTDYSTHGWNGSSRKPADYQAVNVGQLKYIGGLYYTQLAIAGYTASWPSWLYPDPANDSNMAVVGQLKTIFNFDINANLTAPSNVTGSIGSDGTINVSWQESSPNVTGFTIMVSTNGGSTWTTAGSASPGATDFVYTPASGTVGTSQFQVIANNANGSSSGSTSATSSTALPAPSAPPDLSGQLDPSGTGHMVLTWTASTGAASSSYKMEREKLDGSSWETLTSSAGIPYTDTTRAIGYGYRYRVSAITGCGGASSPSAPFPQAKYAIIDLGVQPFGMYPWAINNQGSVLFGPYNSEYPTAFNNTWLFWKAGVTTALPSNFYSRGGLDNLDRVPGYQTTDQQMMGDWSWQGPIEDDDEVPPDAGTSYTEQVAATWSPSGITQLDATAPISNLLAYTGGAPTPYPLWWQTMQCAGTIICDNAVVGTGSLIEETDQIYHTDYDVGGDPDIIKQYFEFSPQLTAGAAIKWSSSATLVGSVQIGSWLTTNTSQLGFDPWVINTAGTIVGQYSIQDQYGATVSSGYGTWNGTLDPLSDDILYMTINNAGIIVGYDDDLLGFMFNGPSGVVLPSNVLPVQINNAAPYGQILDDNDWLWSYDTGSSTYKPENIADYVPGPDDSSWSFTSVADTFTHGNRPLNDQGALIGTATKVSDSTTHGVLLLPMQIVTDLNGDGTIDDKDMGLESAALNSTASPEDDAKKDGTEYLFPDDTISHGIWSKTDSNAPSGTTDDDNAKQIKITCGATFGSVWFDYTATSGPATITNLVFYKTRACLTADKITFPLAVSPTSPMPTTLYVRVEGTVSAETDGKLVMKLGKADQSQTFCQVSMPLDIVTQFGDAHFFQAANRYVLQNNCLHYFGVKTYGSVPIDIVVRNEDYSTMQAVDAYWNSATGAVRSSVLYGIQEVQPAYPSVDEIINGNFCGTRVGTLFYDAIDTTCLGNLITGGALDTKVSTSTTSPSSYLDGPDARYLAMNSSHQFTFGTGIVPTTSGYQEAMGGLGPTGSSDPHYFPTPYNMNMIGEAPVDSKHKVLFTLSYQATIKSPGTVSASMVSDATSSGCLPLPGGTSGEPTLVWTDGSSSIALALKSPPDTSAAGTSGVAGIPTYGTKHTLPTPLDGYYINTYLIFDSTKPRP